MIAERCSKESKFVINKKHKISGKKSYKYEKTVIYNLFSYDLPDDNSGAGSLCR